MLEASEITVRFGGIQALDNVAFEVRPGECLAVIGPNGAGKSTLLNVLSGLVKPTQGSLRYLDHNLLRARTSARSRLGIARTFQHSDLFADLTVIDQLLCGAGSRARYGFWSALLRSRRFLASEGEIRAESLRLLERLGIEAWAHARPERLPGPHRRLVDLGRALMMHPKLLLLDEIAAGLTADEKQNVLAIVREERQESGASVIVIEHDLDFVRSIAETALVLSFGRVIAYGPIGEVLSRPDVLLAYTGEVAAAT